MRIVHISDLHFWRITLNPIKLAGKRLLGMGNLILRRARQFPMKTMPDIVAHILDIAPDHLLITGDLTTTALESEFAAARRALAPLHRGAFTITVMPGNHDRYTRSAARERLFEKYFGEFTPGIQFPWLKKIGPGVFILALDACVPTKISARGRLAVAQIQKARALLDAAGAEVRHLIVACHYPAALPDGVPHLRGHGLRGQIELKKFLSTLDPHLYCHGHVHRRWVFSPKGLTNTLCLNPGAAFKKRLGAEVRARMLEIILNGGGVHIKRHILKGRSWEVQSLIHTTDFFRKEEEGGGSAAHAS